MRPYHRRLAGIALGVLLVVWLSGCDDFGARQDVQQVRQQMNDLKQELDKAKGDLKALTDRLGGARDSLAQEIGGRLDKIAGSATDLEKNLLGKIGETEEKCLRETRTQIASARQDLDTQTKETLNVKVAEQVTALRKEIQTNRDELLGFMDRQLKELYPYAYQPRRLEPATPPAAPQP